tara:strand:- start:167 stop:1369 length:1203 start_codon:yes stop_codon:yes gene_type:complete
MYSTLSNTCAPGTPSWDCINGTCIDPGNGLGQHSSLSACQAACTGTGVSRYNIFRFEYQAFPGLQGSWVSLEVFKEGPGYIGGGVWDSIASITDLTPGYDNAYPQGMIGSVSTPNGVGDILWSRWESGFWPGGIATITFEVTWQSGATKIFTMSCSTNRFLQNHPLQIGMGNTGGYVLIPPMPYDCNPQQSNHIGPLIPVVTTGNCFTTPTEVLPGPLGYNCNQSGYARVYKEPDYPIGVIHKAEVLSDVNGVLADGEEAYHHMDLALGIKNQIAMSSAFVWNLSSEWGNGFKPSSSSNKEQVIKIHSAVVEQGSSMEYTASNGVVYDNVETLANAFGTPLLLSGACNAFWGNVRDIYSTSAGGATAFSSINDLYLTHNSIGNESFFYETIVYADELDPC